MTRLRTISRFVVGLAARRGGWVEKSSLTPMASIWRTSVKKVIFLSLVLAILAPAIAGAIPLDVRFSIDPASPSIQPPNPNNTNITPDDVLRAGPVVHTQGRALGLQDDFFRGRFDNLNALSYGVDPIINPLFFSVDRVAVGKEGSDVNRLAKPGVEDAARHVYMALPPVGTNRLFIDETQLGLRQGFFGDDLNALSFLSGPDTYFSIDALSASIGKVVIPGQPGVRPSDILSSTGNGSFGIFKRAENIGLHPFDEIDALVLDAAGIALFSLSPFSPSIFTDPDSYDACVKGFLSPADICRTDFSGSFSFWASADDLGLLRGDNVNALATLAPTIPIPEPGSLVLLSSGIVAMLAWRRRRRQC